MLLACFGAHIAGTQRSRLGIDQAPMIKIQPLLWEATDEQETQGIQGWLDSEAHVKSSSSPRRRQTRELPHIGLSHSALCLLVSMTSKSDQRRRRRTERNEVKWSRTKADLSILFGGHGLHCVILCTQSAHCASVCLTCRSSYSSGCIRMLSCPSCC